jgi:hypothetical protein
MNRELLKQCLDLITELDKKGLILESGLIFALRDELAKPEQDHGFDRTASHMAGEYVDTAKHEQEPVAYADALDLAKDCNWDTFICKHSSENHEGTRFKIPLYTAPPRKPWVGLTDDEIENIYKSIILGELEVTRWLVCRAIEAKLKELNA